MVKQVKSIEEAIAHVLKSIANDDHNNSNLKNVTADAMHDIIDTNVYDAFTPRDYERRGERGGFLDKNNMVFTNVQNNGNSVNLTFENITTGNDSMYGERIDETLEYGIEKNWGNPEVYDEYGRKNSTARPFIEDTVDELNYRKGELVSAWKKDLKNLGFDVK